MCLPEFSFWPESYSFALIFSSQPIEFRSHCMSISIETVCKKSNSCWCETWASGWLHNGITHHWLFNQLIAIDPLLLLGMSWITTKVNTIVMPIDLNDISKTPLIKNSITNSNTIPTAKNTWFEWGNSINVDLFSSRQQKAYFVDRFRPFSTHINFQMLTLKLHKRWISLPKISNGIWWFWQNFHFFSLNEHDKFKCNKFDWKSCHSEKNFFQTTSTEIELIASSFKFLFSPNQYMLFCKRYF